jgi:hypothetical protein
MRAHMTPRRRVGFAPAGLSHRAAGLTAPGEILHPEDFLCEEAMREGVDVRADRLDQIAGEAVAARCEIVIDAERRIEAMAGGDTQRLGVGVTPTQPTPRTEECFIPFFIRTSAHALTSGATAQERFHSLPHQGIGSRRWHANSAAKADGCKDPFHKIISPWS